MAAIDLELHIGQNLEQTSIIWEKCQSIYSYFFSMILWNI